MVSHLILALLLTAVPAFPHAAEHDGESAEGRETAQRAEDTEARYQALKAEEEARAGDIDFDFNLAIAAIDAGRPIDAVFALSRILAAEPGHLPARAELGRAYAMLGDLVAARRELEIVAAAEDVPEQVRESVRRQIAALDRLLAGELPPPPVSPRAAEIDRELREGLAALEAGRTQAAIAAFQRILAAEPGHLPARAQLGRAHAMAGDLAAARRELATVAAAESVPDEVRARLREQVAALDRQIAARARAARIDRDFREGIAALEAGRTDEAIAVFQRVLAAEPNHLPARAELGRAYAAAGDLAAARRELAIVAEAPSVPEEVRGNIERTIAALDLQLAGGGTQFSGLLSVTAGYDSNVNAATDVERLVIPLFAVLGPATLDPGARAQEDGFAQLAGLASLVHGLAQSRWLVASLAATLRRNFDLDRFDQATLDLNLGYAQAVPDRGRFTIAAQGHSQWVDDRVFRRSLGGLGSWTHRSPIGTELGAFAQYAWLAYPRERARNAHRIVLGGTAGRPVGEWLFLYAGLYGGREKTADSRFDHLSQWFAGARAGGEARLTERLSLFADGALELSKYDEDEPLFLTRRETLRGDVRGGARILLRDNVRLVGTAGYTRADSNIPLFDYKRFTATLGVEVAF